MRTRTLILVAVLALGATAATLVGTRSSAPATAVATPAPPREQPVARIVAPAPVEALPERSEPPPPDDEVFPESDEAAAEEPELTAAERAPKMARAVTLLDDTIARTQADLDAAELEGDTAAASRLRVRVARLHAVRDQRARELAELR